MVSSIALSSATRLMSLDGARQCGGGGVRDAARKHFREDGWRVGRRRGAPLGVRRSAWNRAGEIEGIEGGSNGEGGGEGWHPSYPAPVQNQMANK